MVLVVVSVLIVLLVMIQVVSVLIVLLVMIRVVSVLIVLLVMIRVVSRRSCGGGDGRCRDGGCCVSL